MRGIGSEHRKTQLMLIDAAILAATPFLVIYLGFYDFAAIRDVFVFGVVFYVLLGMSIFRLHGLYHRLWEYADVRDFIIILIATFVHHLIVGFVGIWSEVHVPMNIYFLSWMLVVGEVSMSRVIYKIHSNRHIALPETKENLLIVGAGDAGAMLARELTQNDAAGTVRIVGFVDDDQKKIGSRLAGVSILGNTSDIASIVAQHNVSQIIVAIPSAEGGVVRRIVDICLSTGCQVKIMPGIYSIIDDGPLREGLREVKLEDLLRREPIRLDLAAITKYISGKCVLITGAGGSIGSEIARQISKVGAREIMLLGRGENSIYEIHQELEHVYPEQLYRPIIANITDRDHMDKIFSVYRPQVVFHAAAHKHVPLMEAQPDEAVHNNVFGTKNVAEMADRYGSDIFVLISTDKAVNPTSVMGASKRMAELVIQQIDQHSQTKFVVVRFGNVLGSRGSVVPLFEKQILAGGPVTITDPEMTRYFMTIPEAVQLVLQAGSQAVGGEVFLFDMGKPVKIKDLASDLIRLHGYVPEVDIKIKVVGIRPGEKLYEELLTQDEGTSSTRHKKIFRAKIQPLDSEQLNRALSLLEKTVHPMEVITILQSVIPTYESEQTGKCDV